MFNWPGFPTSGAGEHELADFAEIVCWQQASASMNEFSRILSRPEDNDFSSEGVPEEEEINERAREAFSELEHRHEACLGDYPFEIGANGETLHISQGSSNHKYSVYRYLLLATRLNMSQNRTHAGIDGTLLFEKLAAEVAREYFGDRAKSYVFGTSVSGMNFSQKVEDLCDRLGEGGGFRSYGGSTRARDGKLDIVVWKPFTDGMPSKLIGFGQCKTGTSYRDSLTQLQPDVFYGRWMHYPIVVTPVRMFFISEALTWSTDRRVEVSQEAGLVFDRCRIIDFCNNVTQELIEAIESWTAAAASATGLPTNW